MKTRAKLSLSCLLAVALLSSCNKEARREGDFPSVYLSYNCESGKCQTETLDRITLYADGGRWNGGARFIFQDAGSCKRIQETEGGGVKLSTGYMTSTFSIQIVCDPDGTGIYQFKGNAKYSEFCLSLPDTPVAWEADTDRLPRCYTLDGP